MSYVVFVCLCVCALCIFLLSWSWSLLLLFIPALLLHTCYIMLHTHFILHPIFIFFGFYVANNQTNKCEQRYLISLYIIPYRYMNIYIYRWQYNFWCVLMGEEVCRWHTLCGIVWNVWLEHLSMCFDQPMEMWFAENGQCLISITRTMDNSSRFRRSRSSKNNISKERERNWTPNAYL